MEQHQHSGACSLQKTRCASSREEQGPWHRDGSERTPPVRCCSLLRAAPWQARADLGTLSSQGRRSPADQGHDSRRVPLPWPQMPGSRERWVRRYPPAPLHCSETSAPHVGRCRPALGHPHADPAPHQWDADVSLHKAGCCALRFGTR